MTEVTIQEQASSGLAIRSDQTDWTPEQGQALLEMFNLAGAPHAVIRSYFHVCQTTGLDPFKRQIHLIERSGKFTPQTSIDGFRMIRDRARVFDGGVVEWCGPDGVWRDVWLGDQYPAAARYTLYRKDQSRPVVATALWGAYVQTKRDGSVTQMWARMGAHMLAKVAEALAIRMAFPDDTGGLYTDDEMGQAELDAPSAAPRRERSPGIMDLDTPPVSAPAPAPEQAVGGGFMDPQPADPNVVDAEVVSEPAPAAPAPEQAQPEPVPAPAEEPVVGEPLNMAPEGTPEPSHAYVWAAKLAELVEAEGFDEYKLRVLFDEAMAAGALGEPVPWAGRTMEQAIFAIRDNLAAGAPALQGIQ